MKFKCKQCDKVFGGYNNPNTLSDDRLNLTTKELLALPCQECNGELTTERSSSLNVVEGTITYKDGTSRDFRDRMANVAMHHKGVSR